MGQLFNQSPRGWGWTRNGTAKFRLARRPTGQTYTKAVPQLCSQWVPKPSAKIKRWVCWPRRASPWQQWRSSELINWRPNLQPAQWMCISTRATVWKRIAHQFGLAPTLMPITTYQQSTLSERMIKNGKTVQRPSRVDVRKHLRNRERLWFK